MKNFRSWCATCGVCLVCLLTPLHMAAAEDRTGMPETKELWKGSLYSSTYRAGVCFSSNGRVRGVLHLRLADGQTNIYHFYGQIQNGQIEVRHSSGHVFKGRLASQDAVEGQVKLRNGMKVRLEGKRVHGAQLAAPNCAPLPE